MPFEEFGPRFLEAPDLGGSAVSDDGEQLDKAFLNVKKRFRLAESMLDEVMAAVRQDQAPPPSTSSSYF